MLILISDANILIDIEDGDLTPAIFKLPYEIAVPDVLFELELSKSHRHLLQAGLKVRKLTEESVRNMEELSRRYSRPSIMDHAALALAMQEKCSLLTGDKYLRDAAKKEGVDVHGTIWIVEELLNQKIIQQEQAKIGFSSMRNNGSRLPWIEVDRLLSKWESLAVKNK